VSLVWLRCRAELRRKWRTTVVLAVLLGIGGGAALTALAGAQRTDAAVPAFVTYSLPDDGGFLFGSLAHPEAQPGIRPDSLALAPLERRIVALPQVVAHFRAPYLFVTTQPSGLQAGGLTIIGAADADLLRKVDRPLVLAGSLPDPSRPFEVTVNDLAAQSAGLHVGSRIHLYAYSAAQVATGGLTGALEHIPPPLGPTFTVRVAAIVRFPQDVTAVAPLEAKAGVSYEGDRNVYVNPAFLSLLAARLGTPVQQMPDINLVSVRLRHGAADWKQFAAAAKAAGGSQVFVSSGNVYGVHLAAASAQKGIRLDVIALLIFGALAALVTLALVGQAVARQAALEGLDYDNLAALGATRGQLMAIVLFRAGLIGGLGGILAFIGALLASPLMPVGIARQADVHPGLALAPAILVPGAVVLWALVTISAIVPAWQASRRSADGLSRGRRTPHLGGFTTAITRSPLPPSAAMGARFALKPGSGRTAAPVFTAMLAAALAVGVFAAAVTFGASLGHLQSSPRDQGWNWDVLVGNPNDLNNREAQVGHLLAENRFVGSYSAIAVLAGQGDGSVAIDGVSVPTLLAFDPLKGSVYPPLLDGHPPRAPNQIVLGTQTLESVHRRIGQSVRVATPEGSRTLEVVGRMISPSVGDLFSNTLGDGGWIYGPAVKQGQSQQARSAAGGDSTGANVAPPTVFNLFAVRYAPGVSSAAAFASLRREFGPVVLTELPSEDVLNLQSVDRLPLILAALVALLGVATIGNTLVTSVRRKRRDLAILKTIGLVPRQVAGVVMWQATTFSMVALIVGLPLGIVGGRWAWNLIASNIGAVSPPLVPLLAIGLIVPATLAIGNLVGAVPGWVAARIPPATVMRGE
jgi:ABC-type lipoprotein release transport system permease subunit